MLGLFVTKIMFKVIKCNLEPPVFYKLVTEKFLHIFFYNFVKRFVFIKRSLTRVWCVNLIKWWSFIYPRVYFYTKKSSQCLSSRANIWNVFLMQVKFNSPYQTITTQKYRHCQIRKMLERGFCKPEALLEFKAESKHRIMISKY